MTVLWFLLWSYFAHASPFDDPTIDQAELRYIQASLHKREAYPRATGSGKQVSNQNILLNKYPYVMDFIWYYY